MKEVRKMKNKRAEVHQIDAPEECKYKRVYSDAFFYYSQISSMTPSDCYKNDTPRILMVIARILSDDLTLGTNGRHD